MPVPTETLRNTRNVSIIFAVSSIALMASLVWMIKVDYARPWREFQDHYSDLQASLAHFDVLSNQTHESLEQLAQAQGAVASAKSALAAQQLRTRTMIAALSGKAESQWTEAADQLAAELAGPWKSGFAKRAYAVSEALASFITQQADKPDAQAIAGQVKQDAQFRAQLVELLEWFDLQKLHEKEDRTRGDYARADLEFKGIKGDLNVAAAAYEHEKSLEGADGHGAKEALSALQRVREHYEKARQRVDRLADQRKAIEDQRKLVEEGVTSAERTLARVEKERNDAQTKYAEFSSTIDRGIFNMPMMDFTAPKGTRGRQEIKQAVLPDVRIELNFVRGYQTDRCMTCHAAIADKNFTREALSKRLEKAILAINEEIDRDGRPEAEKLTPPTVEGRGDLQPGGITKAWDTLDVEQQKKLFAELRDEVNTYQKKRGLPELKFGEPLMAHPDLDLFVASDSPHPMSRMGCTVCHEGNGEETDFVLAAHTPKNEKQREEWKEKYYVRTAGMVPEQNFETAEHHWTRPMLQPRYSEAGCVKCHAKAADISMHNGQPTATRINEGRFLFTSLGCINCHLVEELGNSRKVGPDLSHLADKVTRNFAENWILFPHDYRPSTTMPHFFRQENNDARSETAGGDTDPVLRTRTEVVAITEYLFDASNNYDRETPPADLWEQVKDEGSDVAKAAAERGRRLFGSVGCLACHANLAYQPNDENGVATNPLGAQWIASDLATKLVNFAHEIQLEKARWLKAAAIRDARKAKQDPAEVKLGDEAKPLLAIDKEEGGTGLPLSKLEEAFLKGFGSNGFDQAAARKALFEANKDLVPKLDKDDFKGVGLTAEEEALAEMSEDATTGMQEFAAAQFGEMGYVKRVEYAMRQFNTGYDTLFNPAGISGPVFTRFAPELSSVRTKFADYDQAVHWLYDWVKNPRHYSSTTKMPNLRLKRGQFPVINAETGEVTQDKVDADEALDISIYLASLNDNTEFAEKAAKRLPEQDGQDPAAYTSKRDELLRNLLGGLNSADRTAAILRDEGGEMSNQLVDKLKKSLGEIEARKRIEAMDIEQRRWMFLGDKMISHYGCYACHQIRGYETAARPGTELTSWGEKQLTQLDFAFFEPELREKRQEDPIFKNLYPVDPANPEDRALLRECAGTNPPEEIEHTLASFAWHKVRNPRIWDRRKLKGPYEKLKMPNFFLSDEQADAVVTFLLSRKPARVNPGLQVDYAGTPAGMIAEGRNQARELNCVACHKVDGNAAVMHQYILKTDGGVTDYDEINGPPWLRGEGAKVQSGWLFGFLNNVQMLRPWLKVRMPSFHLDNGQGTRLVEFFAGLSQHESQWLAKNLTPVERYIADAEKQNKDRVMAAREHSPSAAGDDPPASGDAPATGPAGSAKAEAPKLPPGANWYQQEALVRTASVLRNYAVQNRLVTSAAVNPVETSAEDMALAHIEIVEKTAFLQHLYDIAYPFSESGRYTPSETAAADGEVLFYELKCMACHVFGDPTIKGANASPSAPNLQLAHERLQSDWVKRWLEAPNRIQPGTKMPNVFGMNGHAGAFSDAPPADRERLLSKLNNKAVIDDPVLQREAITAFLYDAGAKRLNKIQPPEAAVPASAPATEATSENETPASEPAEAQGRSATTQPASESK